MQFDPATNILTCPPQVFQDLWRACARHARIDRLFDEAGWTQDVRAILGDALTEELLASKKPVRLVVEWSARG